MTTPIYKTKERERIKFKKILEALSQLDTKELIAHWIDQEVKEAEMYYRLYTMSKEVNWDEQIPKLFFSIYKDCLEHAEALLKLYRTMYPGEEVIKVNVPALEVELSEDRLRELVFKGNLRGILEYLMGTEKIAHDVYSYLAEQTTDEKVRATLIWLAEIENGHYEKLRRLYVTLFGDYPEEEEE
ncbi:rubrerythrin-related protein [Thermococcus onnurineus NA1]|uniref:Rubrerythrin-related protein n=2 Tax=Thermococcaceae TaxID=2259 RepID=B6YTK8_THEON|nr:rubrerythrin-related protein [Thermococcus onnurineus NA1]NJE46392.1 rubrerythrin [Thermococcus sp. GR7]NJE77689.1 rubrerythrin [Thermococcus sp. GR4]NJF23728.1 rubrerythrin [Thermococcus sp. GR5]